MRVIGIIPSRYQSNRFPGKPLVDILGKPMVVRVADLSAKAIGSENVYVATDDERIGNVVEEHGYNVIYTSKECLTGTDRVAEAAMKIESKYSKTFCIIFTTMCEVNQGTIHKVRTQKVKQLSDQQLFGRLYRRTNNG